MRLRLLVSFIAFALFVLLIFGVVAYQIAIDNGIERETDLLQRITKKQASMLAAQNGSRHWQKWLHIANPESNEYLALNAGSTDELRPYLSSATGAAADSSVYKNLKEKIASGIINGQIEF